MDQETIIPGLEFVRKHKLTTGEINVLVHFLRKSWLTVDLAKELNVDPKTIYHFIQRLKLKGLIVLKDKDADGNYHYELCKEALQ